MIAQIKPLILKFYTKYFGTIDQCVEFCFIFATIEIEMAHKNRGCRASFL